MQKVITTCIATAILLTNNAVAEFNFNTIPKKLTAYYASAIQPLPTLKSRLTANGFEILDSTEVLDGKTVLTITNSELKATNTYMATLHILVNSIKNEIRVQNPSYLGAAYFQNNYKYGQFKATLYGLEASLGTMNEVAEKTIFSKLANYRFMFGMPHLEDYITVVEGGNPEEKITGSNADKYFAYSLKLSNGVTLVGHKLGEKTNKFLQKIAAEHNAQLLPYEAMIINGKVTILDPKYYLALSLPLLSMNDFMKIATTPDQIVKDIRRAYK